MSFASPSRREFFALSSLALASSKWSPSNGYAVIPANAREPLSTFVPELISAETLQALAQVAVDTARQNGASYADVRVAHSRRLLTTKFLPPPRLELQVECRYGIRVLVDGVWAFAYGVDFTSDSVARTARSAVTTARGLKPYVKPRPPMVPRAAVKGEWSSPMRIDPFSVSPDEHGKLLGALSAAAERVLDGEPGRVEVAWTSERRVFASTEGSLLTQHFGTVEPCVDVRGIPIANGDFADLRVGGLAPAMAGFETLLAPDIQERIKTRTEEARYLANLPRSAAEVGRYPAVFDALTAGSLLSRTLVPALEMDRVLGYEADSVGTSFLAPVNEVLNQPLFAPALNLMAGRTAPVFGAAKWDDEGVETESFPVIQDGRVVNYFATRAAAAASESSVRPRGCTVSHNASKTPLGKATHVTMPADRNGPTLDELVKSIPNGILVLNSTKVNTNQQMASGLLEPEILCEVKNGKITRQLENGVIQFSTKVLWKNLAAIGNEQSAEDALCTTYEGEVPRVVSFKVPALQFKAVDLINRGRRF